MMKKTLYCIIAGSAAVAAQGTLASSFVPAQSEDTVNAPPAQYRYESTPAARITAIPFSGRAASMAGVPASKPAQPSREARQRRSDSSSFPPVVD